MRLILISIATLAVVGMTLSTIHFWGLSQSYLPYNNEFFSGTTPWIVVPAEKISGQPDEFIAWMDVGENDFEKLSAWLEKNPGRKLILNITDNRERIDEKVVSTLEKVVGKKADGKVLIQSPFDVVMSSIKEKKPMLAYGSSQADRMRFRTFQSMGILTATPFKGDVYVGPLIHNKVPLFSQEIRQEMNRRHKKVILGRLETAEEVQQALRLDVDGVYMENPSLLIDAVRR